MRSSARNRSADALEMAHRRLNTRINVLRGTARMGSPVGPFPKQTTHLGAGRGLLEADLHRPKGGRRMVKRGENPG